MEVLFVPWALLLLILILTVLLIKKWYKASLFLILLLLCINWHYHVISFGLKQHRDINKESILRVMTWNVNSTKTLDSKRCNDILSLILRQEADIVFLTEILVSENHTIDSVLQNHYMYHNCIKNEISYSEFYSKFPIVSCRFIGNGDQGLLFNYDVSIKSDVISIYCVHLNSNNTVNGESFYPDSIRDRNGILRYLQNYKVSSSYRVQQIHLIKEDLTDIPTIIMGDMNDVYGSLCINELDSLGMQDAWWVGGCGYGATIHNPLPYRIDHVIYSETMKLRGIDKLDGFGLSDHDAIVVDFELQQ